LRGDEIKEEDFSRYSLREYLDAMKEIHKLNSNERDSLKSRLKPSLEAINNCKEVK